MKMKILPFCLAIFAFVNSQAIQARPLSLVQEEVGSLFQFVSDAEINLRVDYYKNGPYVHIGAGNSLLVINEKKMDGYMSFSPDSDVDVFRDSTRLIVPRGKTLKFKLTHSYTFQGNVRLVFAADLGRIRLANGDYFKRFWLFQEHYFKTVRQAREFISDLKSNSRNTMTTSFR